MNDDEQKRLHSAGATVLHLSPFSSLEVPARKELPPKSLVDKWIRPFYMLNLWSDGAKFVRLMRPHISEIDNKIAAELLSYFDWRPRIVGGYLVAIKLLTGLEELVGRLLLRSDVCDAGGAYCVALARLNTPASIEFLIQYLDYYLARPNLWFEQATAMSALGHLDRCNGTAYRDTFVGRWSEFIADKPGWSLQRSDSIFAATFAAIVEVSIPEGCEQSG